jgi:hypothetical protein
MTNDRAVMQKRGLRLAGVSAVVLSGLMLAMAPSAALAGKIDNSESAAPAAATPAADPQAFIDEVYALCHSMAGDDMGALDTAYKHGWSEGDTDGDGPFYHMFDATKTFDGIGDVELWGTMENYPAGRLGYCRIDVTLPEDSTLALESISKQPGLTGKITNNDDGNYGVWSSTSEPQFFAIAQIVGSDFQLEVNAVLPQADKDDTAKGDAKP